MAKKNTNEVAEYLVKRIKELEKEKDDLQAKVDMYGNACLLLDQKASKFIEVQKLFELSGDGITKAIIVRDLHGGYVGILAIDTNEDFNKYLELLELNGKEEQK